MARFMISNNGNQVNGVAWAIDGGLSAS